VASSELLSIQCRSSRAYTKGLRSAPFTVIRRNAPMILCFLASGLMEILSIPLSFTESSSRRYGGVDGSSAPNIDSPLLAFSVVSESDSWSSMPKDDLRMSMMG
jgi:hypothetical protein